MNILTDINLLNCDLIKLLKQIEVTVSCVSLYAVITHNVLTINTICLVTPNDSSSSITTRQALGKLDSNLKFNHRDMEAGLDLFYWAYG